MTQVHIQQRTVFSENGTGTSRPRKWIATRIASATLLSLAASATSASISVADATLAASFYSDASCLLTIDSFVRAGKTVIDAEVDSEGSRMLIHCDTDDGRRLTILARGDSLNVEQRAPLLNRQEIAEGEYGIIAWLTGSGVDYTDDSVPRRYIIGGSVKMRSSPPMDVAGSAINSSKHTFASIIGVLESIIKSDDQELQQIPQADDQEPTPADESEDAKDKSAEAEDRSTADESSASN